MKTETHAFGRLSVEAKRDFVQNIFRREHAAAKPAAGRFNPTRLELLKQFRLDQPIVRGSGHRLYDAQGREYLDFLSQYGAVPFGQNPPELWQILRRAESEQLASMIQPLVPRDAQRLAERLGEITPGDLEICVFTNSGAEAVEAAIKLARAKTGRPLILSTQNGFHGKTLGALSATGRPMYQAPFFAPVPHFDYVPFGSVDALAQRLKQDDAKEIAAFIVEPIQGEGGVIPAPAGYLAAASALCRRHGVLLIVDEIQTGLGRTGSMFAFPAEAGTPDILVLSKALGGGLMPIGACIARKDAWDDRFGILHSSTFANNNLACRVAVGVIDMLQRDGGRIMRHVAAEGAYLIDRLQSLHARYPNVIKDVRGKGFMTALEFHPFAGDDGSGTLAYCSLNDGLIALFSAYLFNAHRIVTAPTFNSSHVMRLQPPLTVGRPEIDRTIGALTTLCDALDRMDCHELVQHLVEARPSQAKPSRRTYATRSRSACISKPAAQPERHGKFAFLLHYSMPDDIVRADPSFDSFSTDELQRWRDWAGALDPGVIHHVKDVRSQSASAEGWLIAIPMLPRDMVNLGRARMMAVLEQAKDVAQERGATVLGLGGFTSIVSRGGQDLVDKGLSVSTGNTLTSIMAMHSIEEAAAKAGLPLERATVAVVGATGSIGRLMSLMLGGRVEGLALVGNPGSPGAIERCRAIADEVRGKSGIATKVTYGVNLSAALAIADIVVAATNADDALVSPSLLRPGTLVCDVARPPNVASDEGRRDMLVFDGGLVRLPQPITLGPIEGLPPGICWGCLGETILLTLEGENADWSIGQQLTLAHADRLAALARSHDIRCAPLQRFGREFGDEDFAGVREAVRARRV